MALTNLNLVLPGLGSSPGGLIAENKYLYPSFELPSGTVTVRTNLCTNPSFETNTTGWGVTNGATLARSTVRAHTGSASLLVTRTASTDDYVHFQVSGLTPSDTYTASFYAYLTGDGVTFNNRAIIAYGGAGTSLIRGDYDRTKINQWQRVSATAVIGSSGTLQVRAYAMTGFNLYVDAVQIEAGSTASDYFDGSTPAAGGFEYAWSGTANASTSIMRAKGLLGVSDDGVYQSQEWAAEGTYSAFVPAGKTLTVALAEESTVKVIARNAGQTMTVGGNPVTSVTSNETLSAFGDTAVVLGPGHWDVLTIVAGVYTGPPFSGSSDYTGYSTAWTGTPDESTSTLSYAPLASPLGDIVSWSITEPTTPHNIHRRNGSTGAASVTAKAREDTYWTISEDANITVDGLQGTFVGTINQSQISPFQEHGGPSGGVTFSIESVLNQLNAERTLAPVVNEPLSDVVATYVAAVAPTLTVTWLASTNPTKTYSAWSGNVWDILKTLCAANNIEMALNGSTLLIRDLGTNIVRFDSRENQGFDVENVSLSITPGSGQFVEITYRDSVAIDNQASYNYVDNPSVEINATGYGVRTTAFGAISGSRVTN